MATMTQWLQQLHDYAVGERLTSPAPEFLSAYYEDADVQDLQVLPLSDNLAAAQSHFEWAQQARETGQPLVRAFNQDAQSAFAPSQTVVQIVFDDAPFLIDSLIMLLNRFGNSGDLSLQTSLQLLVHPVLTIQRDQQGVLQRWARTFSQDEGKESWVQVRLDRLPESVLPQLEKEIVAMLLSLHSVVGDEAAMRTALSNVRRMVAGQSRLQDAEVLAFLDWLADNHFLLMGFCEYDLVQDDQGQAQLEVRKDSQLGIFLQRPPQRYSTGFSALSASAKQAWLGGSRLALSKSQQRSILHRPVYYDLVGVQKLNADGQVVGQWRFMGLYTAHAYLSEVWDIPVLREKCKQVVEQCDYVTGSYKDKMLRFILQTYPRDELLEIAPETLAPIAAGMVSLQERPRTRLFMRVDDFKRYISALVFLPREHFNTELRQNIAKLLSAAFGSNEHEFSVQQGDGPLARVHFFFRTQPDSLPDQDEAALERQIESMVRGWRDAFVEQCEADTTDNAEHLLAYQNGFSAAYREMFNPAEAAADVVEFERARLGEGLPVRFQAALDDADAPIQLKMYYRDKAPSLSKILPIIENMGVRVHEELPYEVFHADGTRLVMSHLGLEVPDATHLARLQQSHTQDAFEALLVEIMAGRVENDGFNALVVTADLDWRASVLMRALGKYLKQATLPFSQNYVEQCLQRHGGIVTDLVALFTARLHPTQADAEQATRLETAVREGLNAVQNVDDDRILNAFLTVILAVVRTNFWQSDASGSLRPTVSFKISSGQIDFLPKPHPMFEIWVYSPRVEGVHLRGAKVARGGLRWSDRMEDFRTEVLGLVKAQMVKNAVIVPGGSKGGFVCKQLPPPQERAAYAAEGVACYQLFINALLDLTDNLQAGQIVPPQNTHRRDEDDPYLVVAADKGTAKFSDVANALAAEHGFWLDDAFASGGSVGYDHKGMGITARGAWESVKRHFRHLDKDIQNEDFTVVGIGDMGGDVFGNGMLLSKHIRLQAAFNHVHIFLDPNPDAATSFAERQRLFDAVAGWDEYNRELISEGGGVFERSAKRIPLSPQVRAWLGIEAESMPPTELIHLLLQAEVELLYNGGIGTYIKASSESHADARDRANDGLRVDGCQVRAKVLGEGGNLGVTQLGRIEYWQHGGRCCTDAIDNSAGVDCSDHEVNIKILLGAEVQQGHLSMEQRNVLLKEMTDDVAALVLQDNYRQTQILAMNQLDPAGFLPAHVDLIRFLEQHGGLNRRLEFLPSDAEISNRVVAKQGLTNPEVAVLLSYSKMHCQDELLASDVPDDEHFVPVLVHYFPEALQQRYLDSMPKHYLKREIIASQLANRMVNRMGVSFAQRLTTEMGVGIADVTRAYWVASELLDAEAWFGRLEALDNRIPAEAQMRLMAAVARLVSRVARGLLRDKRPLQDMAQLTAKYREPLQALLRQLPQWVAADAHAGVAKTDAELSAYGVFSTEERALLARLPYAENLMAVLDLAEQYGQPIETVAARYFDLAERLQMDWLYRAVASLPRDNQWQNQACLAMREDVQNLLLQTVGKDLAAQGSETTEAALLQSLAQAEQQIIEMQAYQQVDLAMLSALTRSLSNTLLK